MWTQEDLWWFAPQQHHKKKEVVEESDNFNIGGSQGREDRVGQIMLYFLPIMLFLCAQNSTDYALNCAQKLPIILKLCSLFLEGMYVWTSTHHCNTHSLNFKFKHTYHHQSCSSKHMDPWTDKCNCPVHHLLGLCCCVPLWCISSYPRSGQYSVR